MKELDDLPPVLLVQMILRSSSHTQICLFSLSYLPIWITCRLVVFFKNISMAQHRCCPTGSRCRWESAICASRRLSESIQIWGHRPAHYCVYRICSQSRTGQCEAGFLKKVWARIMICWLRTHSEKLVAYFSIISGCCRSLSAIWSLMWSLLSTGTLWSYNTGL